MYDTAEIRWILEGHRPPAVERWFGDGRTPTLEEREDTYIVLPGCETVGIKLRGGVAEQTAQLDVKARRGSEAVVRLGADVIGRAAAWTKWSLALARADAIVAGLGPETPRLTVRKRRLLRRFTTGGDRFAEIAPDDEAPAGCDIELATITLGGLRGTWWSIGLEAFGPVAAVQRTLRMAGPAWFERHGAPPTDGTQRLEVGSSIAYPAWLSRLLGTGQQAVRQA